MNKYNLLILTDHGRHTMNNSLYELARALSKNRVCNRVDVASRGMPGNHDFFFEKKSTAFQVVKVSRGFHFEEAPDVFTSHLLPGKLSDYDFILLRLPHPIDAPFLKFLTSHFDENRIMNRPSGMLTAGSKAFLLEFAPYCPPMKICKNGKDVLDFAAQFPLVLKPFYGHGGAGIVKTDGKTVWMGNHEVDFRQWADVWRKNPEPYLAMQFLENVTEGDKRILVVNGKIMGASLRLPKEGSWMCNVSLGGKSIFSQPDRTERIIAKALMEKLHPLGIGIFGFDTLMGNEGKRLLSEINVLSIGGIVPMEKESGKPIVRKTANEIWKWLEDEGWKMKDGDGR
jgi:glutathione synthase